MVQTVVPESGKKSLRCRVWASDNESPACDVGCGQLGDAPRQRIETPGVHAVRQNVLPVVREAVTRVFACLPRPNQERVFRFFKAELRLMLFNLRLNP